MLPWSHLKEPMIALNRVVFPDPLGPMRPTISFSSTLKSRLKRAISPPKDLDKAFISRRDIRLLFPLNQSLSLSFFPRWSGIDEGSLSEFFGPHQLLAPSQPLDDRRTGINGSTIRTKLYVTCHGHHIRSGYGISDFGGIQGTCLFNSCSQDLD